ncbi:MAG: O-antigen ligase family protein, partial [Clostridia bacterium]|nr:O-antigen ligase family protein [Clostridia bacterium]
MHNLMNVKYDNLRKLTINLLIIYLVSTVFERQAGLSFISSVGIYAFLVVGLFYICLKSNITGIGNTQFTVRAILCIFAVVSLIWIPEEIRSRANSYCWRFFTSVVIAFIVGNIVYSQRDVKKILFGFCLAGAFLSLNFYITYGSEIMTLAQKVEAAERMGQEYGNVNEVAQRCMFAFIISIYYGFFNKNCTKKMKYLAIVNTVVCFSVIMFTGSKRALLVIVATIIVMFFKNADSGSTRGRIGVILKGLVAVLLILYLIMNVPMFAGFKERFEVFFQTLGGNITDESGSDLNRIRYITEGFNYFKNNILFGGGICYSLSMFGTYAHNNYIEMLINFGLVGFVIYYYGYVSNFIKMRKLQGSRFDEVKNLFFVLMIA